MTDPPSHRICGISLRLSSDVKFPLENAESPQAKENKHKTNTLLLKLTITAKPSLNIHIHNNCKVLSQRFHELFYEYRPENASVSLDIITKNNKTNTKTNIESGDPGAKMFSKACVLRF